MFKNRTTNLLVHLRQLALAGDVDQLSDGQLLEYFLAHKEEAAFTALVRRHGPLVYNVCRRVLRHETDAEDAFQATFLVLLRKAHSLTDRELLANWLYGVAYRTALEARTAAARRQRKEQEAMEMCRTASPAADLWSDVRPVLDHELHRLPEKYRLPVVLCDLEGKPRQEAAKLLRCSEGTLSGRLARARRRLARRLTQRGIGLSSAALAFVLAENASATPLAAGLVATTGKTIAAAAAGAAVPAHLTALMQGVLKAMALSKLKLATTVLLLVGLLGVGIGLVALQAQTQEPSQLKKDATAKAVAKDPEPIPKELLRYDGKTFAEWRQNLRTELKPESRAEGIQAMGTFGINGYGEEAVRTIFDVMKAYNTDSAQHDPHEKLIVAAALLQLGKLRKEAQPIAIEALKDRNENIRLFALHCIHQSVGIAKENVPELVKATKDPVPAIRIRAFTALGYHADTKDKVAAIAAGLKDEEANVRYQTAQVLSRMGPQAKDAIPALLVVLVPKDDPNRELFLNALATITNNDPSFGRQRGGFSLRPRTTSTGGSVEGTGLALTVGQALRIAPSADLKGKGLVPLFVEVLKVDPQSGDHYPVLKTLGELGAEAKEAVPILKEILKRNQSVDLADAINQALSKIEQ